MCCKLHWSRLQQLVSQVPDVEGFECCLSDMHLQHVLVIATFADGVQGSGMSVMEMSHRGKEFMQIASEAEADLRQLLQIPDNYKVLFMQGGATTQFAAVPLNLADKGDTIDYVVTGSWSKKAHAEGQKFCNANLAAKVCQSALNNIMQARMSSSPVSGPACSALSRLIA